jgi:hypothetical protein
MGRLVSLNISLNPIQVFIVADALIKQDSVLIQWIIHVTD